MRLALAFLLALPLLASAAAAAEPKDDAAAWTVYVTNDNCPDYTWGLTEEQTRQAFADIVRGHLDEMNRTDALGGQEPKSVGLQTPADLDRYNMAVTQEALCFVEKYPDRKDELIRRIKEGRIFVSPYLCNSLWGMASVEQTIRTLYPARRLERQWGIPKIEWAEHIEEPCLPWGTATILAGCGIRWLSNPFYNYDSTFGGLKNPPLFIYAGPDGSRLRVVMDPWASNKFSYMQGARLLANPQTLLTEWLPHYRSLGAAYPVRAILASGTHGDISPGSGEQARGFAEKLAKYNAGREPAAGAAGDPGTPYPAACAAGSNARPLLVNATLPMFCRAVDEAQARTPFLPTVRGDFGHSWDAWPVSLAKYAAAMREGERQFLAAEALVAVAGLAKPELYAATRADRERAEWCWAMLSDHAWNGTDEKNQRHNAQLRERRGEELNRIAADLQARAWKAASQPDSGSVTMFNPSSVPRGGLVRVEGLPEPGPYGVYDGGRALPAQWVGQNKAGVLYFVSPAVPAYGCRTFHWKRCDLQADHTRSFRVGEDFLEGPFYRLSWDERQRFVGLVHKPSGREVLAPDKGRGLCQTSYWSGRDAPSRQAVGGGDAAGAVFVRLDLGQLIQVQKAGDYETVILHTYVSLYADLDRVDVEVRIEKPVTTAQERLCQVFPVMREGAVVRVETPGAVIRPRPQPEGDLLPGADTRRVCVQGFVDVSMPDGPGVTIVPLDAFLLRLDQEPLTFEALGNDQNYKEVCKDQNGVTEFRFRYSLRFHAGPYNQAEAVAFSRDVMMPLMAFQGAPPPQLAVGPGITIDPARAIATAFKPADDPVEGGVILRLWETAGKAEPLAIRVPGFRRAMLTDLLERDLGELKVEGGAVKVDLRPHGFGAIRLLP